MVYSLERADYTSTNLGRSLISLMGPPTDANEVRPVGRAEARVAFMPLIGVPTSIVQWGEVSGIRYDCVAEREAKEKKNQKKEKK